MDPDAAKKAHQADLYTKISIERAKISKCTRVEFLKTVQVLISNLNTSVEVDETLVNNDSL